MVADIKKKILLFKLIPVGGWAATLNSTGITLSIPVARPNKLNADYHSHDKDMRNDLAIKALRKRYGHEGYSVYNMMLEVLTGSDNWQHPWNEKTIELLAADFDSDKLKEIIGYATETLDLFNLS